jgi:hypothetical protein
MLFSSLGVWFAATKIAASRGPSVAWRWVKKQTIASVRSGANLGLWSSNASMRWRNAILLHNPYLSGQSLLYLDLFAV